MTPQELSQHLQRIREEVGKALLGQDEVIEQVLLAVFAKGHVLIEGVPGLGKTLLVRTLARVLGCEFKRCGALPEKLGVQQVPATTPRAM